ncbi:MAG: peptidase M61 [Comamonadaceae bacterium]
MNGSTVSRSVAIFALLFWSAAMAQPPSELSTPDPIDQSYPGVLTVAVDATDLDHHVFQIRETLSVTPGPLSLLYPLWLPGWHGPGGDVTRLAGLVLRAGDRRVPWTRDPVAPEVLHLVVPTGVSELTIEFQHLAPVNDVGGRTSVSRELVNVDWNTVLLYPAGYFLSAIRARASLRLPEGFSQATALRPVNQRGTRTEFAEVSLETLIDSPVFAGRHYKRIDLDATGAPRPVVLHLFADEADQLVTTDDQIEAHRALVRQADRLFGARHFAHYDLLLEQSKVIGGIGLEHHESSENAVHPGYFKDWAKGIRARQLLPHEYTHSWNGKFRRPIDLWTPNLNVPMRTSLLWVYEGQTEYWGRVLASRSALVTPEQARDQLARTAAYRAAMPGRTWRSLQDTTADPLLEHRAPRSWPDLQRGFDYYAEMALVWLDVDTLIRERSGEQRSLDDFARTFFGVQDGRVEPLTYTFDELVAALTAVEPYDWATLLRDRLEQTGEAGHLLDGLTRSGWKLDFDDQESESAKNAREEDEEKGPRKDLYWSIGVVVGKEGKLIEVRWNGEAFHAGLAPGIQIVAVQGVAYTPERLTDAIATAKGAGPAVELLVKEGERYRQVMINYHGGLRYPKLVRIDSIPDRLSAILAPK